MQVESAKGRSKRYYYYNCIKAQKYGGDAPRRIPADDLDAWLVDVVLERILTPGNLRSAVQGIRAATSSWEKDRAARLAKAQNALAELQQRNNNIFELFELHGKDAPNLSDLTDRLRQNKKRIDALENEIGEISAEQAPEIAISDQDVTELAESLRYIIKTSEDPKKVRSFFRSFIRDIWVEESDIRIEYHPEVLVKNRQPIPVPSTSNWLPEPSLLGTTVLQIRLPTRFRKKAA